MFKYFISICALIISVNGAGEFSVLSHPSSVLFKGHDHLKASLLKEVYSASLGYTTEQDSNWQGLYLLDPFNLAKSIVTVAIDGVADIGQIKGQHFPLKTDEDESDIYYSMVKRVEDRHPSGDNTLVRIELDQGLYAIDGVDVFSGINDIKPQKTLNGGLKLTIDEDRSFLEELALLNAISDKIKEESLKNNDVPDIFWFKVSNLHVVSDLHGENSTATKEAKQLLIESIDRLNLAFKNMYDGKVLFNIITSDSSHTRRIRRDTEPEKAEKFDNLNLAKTYSTDYPVIFNIILWFGVVMVFSLLAISVFIASMDPGRDSIIYRMTSTRMKKDN